MTEPIEKRQELAPGLFLYMKVWQQPTLKALYELEAAKHSQVRFTLDIRGSENLRILHSSDALQKTTDVYPFERKLIGEVIQVNQQEYWSLKSQYSWQEEEPDAAYLNSKVIEDEKALISMVQRAQELMFGADSLTVAEINTICSREGIPFIDPEFPPLKQSLYSELSSNAERQGQRKITWRRPEDFFGQDKFDLFVDGISPQDIRQGSLGDCWFLCAVAALTESSENIRAMFKNTDSDANGQYQTTNSHGAYRVRLCKGGQWLNVLVDSYLPCVPGSGPVYAKTHSNELWVSLLEKAYAKVHGNYDALRAGFAYEAMMDLTGCPTMKFYFEHESVQDDIKSGKLWESLVRFDRQGAIMSCSTPGEDTFTEIGGTPQGGPGLVSGHAYTLLQCVETSTGEKIVEIRNPWGAFEWNGDWSDQSPKWTQQLRDEIKPTLAVDDGSFWMSYNDFLKFFDGINVCFLGPKRGQSWHEVRTRSAFSLTDEGRAVASGAILRVDTPSTVWVTIHQQDKRVVGSPSYIDIGATVLKTDADGHVQLKGSTGIVVDRQASVQLELEAGEYFIVPITTGCKFARAQSSARAESPCALYANGVFTPACERALREVFVRLDTDMDGILNRHELNAFQQITEGCDMDNDTFTWLLNTFDSRAGGLTPDGFVDAYEFIFENSGCDQSVLWKDLLFMGYNHALELARARSFVLSVHSSSPVQLRPSPFNQKLYDEAIERPVVEQGSLKPLADGRIEVYMLQTGMWGLSIAAKNCTNQLVALTMDCSNSVNMMSHVGKLVNTVTIAAGETEILHHLMPIEQKEWNCSFSTKWEWLR